MAMAVWMNVNMPDIRSARERGTLQIVAMVGKITGDTYYAICDEGGAIETYETVAECKARIAECR